MKKHISSKYHSRLLRNYIILSNLFLLFLLLPKQVQAQVCECNEYIYLNEPGAGGKIHKYLVNANGTLTEINPTGPWYNDNTTNAGLDEPHGLARDLNGYYYISETSNGDVRKLDCDGNILPESDFVISGKGGWNFASIGNTVYINRTSDGDIGAYSLCDGSFQSAANFCETSSSANNDWGFYYDKRTGYFYSAFKGTGATTDNRASILRYTTASFDNGAACIPVWIGPGDGTLTVGVSETVPNTFIRGMTTDADGNLYIVERLPDQFTARILKYDVDGKFVAATAYDGIEGDGGWALAAGVSYSETSNQLYVSTASDDDDCISRFDLDLNYLGAAVGAGGGDGSFTAAKAIAIEWECCPTVATQTLNQTFCGAAPGTEVFLNQFLPCENICAGKWTVVGNNPVGTFNECNSTITFQNNGRVCFKYTYDPNGNPNAVCSAFEIDVCVTFVDSPTATLTQTAPTCSGGGNVGTPNNDGTISIQASTNVTRFGISTAGATRYNGPNYAAATVFTSNGQAVSSTIPNTGGTYIVRLFNGSNRCFIEQTVTVAPVVCTAPVCNAPTPSGTAENRCGNGTVTLAASGCTTGYTATWYSNSGLTTLAPGTNTGNSYITPSLSTTTSYWVACVETATPTCKSSGVEVIATINDAPTTTAAATNATCTGPTVNSDGKITLSGFTTERYDFTTGSSYSGSATFGTATAIPAGGVIVSNLPNPATSQAYTVRIFSSAGCFVDRTVTLTTTNCSCPVIAAPAVGNASRCGMGTLTVTIATACASGNSLKIFSDAALTTDVTSQFTIAGTSVTSPSISTTTTYFAACVSDAFPACKSSGDNIVLTINDAPTTTAAATNATCSGPTVNSDGKITLSGFTTERYDFTTGSSYSGSATFGTATAIPAGGVIVSNLPNPAASQAYTVRIFSSAGCFVDRTVTLTTTNCSCPVIAAPVINNGSLCGPQNAPIVFQNLVSTSCANGSSLKIFSNSTLTTPTPFTILQSGSNLVVVGGSVAAPDLSTPTTFYAACVSDAFPACTSIGDEFVLSVITPPNNATPTTTAGTCNGANLNDDATISVGSIVGDKIAISTANAASFDGAAYASATSVNSGTHTFSNLQHGATYIIRIYNTQDCTKDVTFSTANRTCCPSPNCGTVTVIKN